jgi:hypothetical protein
MRARTILSSFVAAWLLTSSAFVAARPRLAFPSEVLVRGTDIETEPHNVTLRLRDALEALIAGRNPTPDGIITKIYLPDDVAFIGSDRFRYRTLLVDAQLRTLRRKGGICRLRDTSSCARQILQGLRVEHNGDRPSTAATQNHVQVSAPSAPVEIRRVGDDGLTVRFADALEAGIRRSLTFTLAGRDPPGNVLVVQIPSNLGWTRVGDRIRVRFEIEFLGPNLHALGRSNGSCWESQLQVCVDQVVSDATNLQNHVPTHP